MATDARHDRQVRGRWISAGSAERNLGLLRPAELDRLREFGTARRADAGARRVPRAPAVARHIPLEENAWTPPASSSST